MVDPNEIKLAIEQHIPDAQLTIEDLSGGGDHLQINVVSKSFDGLSLIKQHQLVYKALEDYLANESIHALALNTSSPST